MKKFCLELSIFMLILIITTQAYPIYLIYTNQYQTQVVGTEIYTAIQQSKQKSKWKKVLIGDSVADQLFANQTDYVGFNSLACNQSIGMIGHFILVNNYLNAGNRLDTLILLFNPSSFINNLDQVYTFSYFLKPFYKPEYYRFFSPQVKNQIKNISYYQLSQLPSILTSNWTPEFAPSPPVSHTFLSPISMEYLLKIKLLAQQKSFKIIILPTPVRQSQQANIAKINKNEIHKTGLKNEVNYVHFEFRILVVCCNSESFIVRCHL